MMPQTRSKRAHVRRPARELCLRTQKLVIPSLRAGRVPLFLPRPTGLKPTGAARLPRDGVAVGKRNLSLVRHVALYATAENLRSIVRAGISYGDEKLTLHAHMAQPTLPIYMGKRVRVA